MFMKTIAIIPESAPFTPSQRLWLNGYLAGLLGEEPAPENNSKTTGQPAPVPLLILFGSQTGTAEKLAKSIAREAKTRNCDAKIIDAADHAKINWKSETNLLVITSTYGDGDMPDNAQSFWDWLQAESANCLSHLTYSVLALGDTNYEQFCAAGKKIDARLTALGATCLHPIAECDLDYEPRAREWTNSVLQLFTNSAQKAEPLDLSARIENVTLLGPGSESSSGRLPAYNRNRPFPARLVTNQLLNGPGSGKETRHFEIALENSTLDYEPGDALGVIPRNCPEQVAELLQALGCNGEEPVRLENAGEISFHTALLEHFDITKPSSDLLKWVSKYNPELKDLLASGHNDHLKQWLYGREIIDLLLTIRNGKVPPSDFIKLLKRIAPRLYSISSSPKAHSDVHLTVSIVRYQSFGRIRKGVASTYLADRAADSTVPVYIQSAHGFRLPGNGDTPVIMVGPGTGIAPFRGFLHHRRAIGATGRNWLFFGEQHSATEFYYQTELQSMKDDGHLTKLSTAFSRDQNQKVYVQHRMIEEGAELWSWLEDGAHFYVCGDAARMAKDVESALHQIIQTHGNKTLEDAAAYIAKLKSEKRYQRDVY
jgi:sulfite reductase (NADPH) flavoprotein alpha-component